LGPNILLSSLFSDILNIHVLSLEWQTKFHAQFTVLYILVFEF
jgi:hypothetical protein